MNEREKEAWLLQQDLDLCTRLDGSEGRLLSLLGKDARGRDVVATWVRNNWVFIHDNGYGCWDDVWVTEKVAVVGLDDAGEHAEIKTANGACVIDKGTIPYLRRKYGEKLVVFWEQK